MKGKCKSGVHQKSIKSAADLEREVPVISFDYMNPKSEDGKDRGIDSLQEKQASHCDYRSQQGMQCTCYHVGSEGNRLGRI